MITLHEAGASNQESNQTNARNLRLTKSKERRRETYQDETEGHPSTQRTYDPAAMGRQRGRKNASGQTRADLYAEATRNDISGRSKMSKVELERVLHYRRSSSIVCRHESPLRGWLKQPTSVLNIVHERSIKR